MKHRLFAVCSCMLFPGFAVAESVPSRPEAFPEAAGLLLDLDAERGVLVEDGDRVHAWRNQAPGNVARNFVKRDEGRERKGSGRPHLRSRVPELNGRSALVFRQGELVNMEEDAFDGLTTGKGFTWFCVFRVYEQRVGLKDVNALFGNLRNGAKYEGLWLNVRDDNTVWTGGRNGLTFGRFDENNPLMLGPRLEVRRGVVAAGRMPAGAGARRMELFVNDAEAVAAGMFPVAPDADPSRMAVGQERDAIEHPGKESFDGEIARLLIYEGALSDEALAETLGFLRRAYLPPGE